jgi:hypothetical protein
MFRSNRQHLENQTVAWELIRCFVYNVFVKYSNGTLAGGDFYSGREEVIKGSGFVNSVEIQYSTFSGGGVEYLHRDPASRKMRRNGKSQIRDSKIWS